MSYLSNRLRLHFAGQFQATVSTVNNDVTHFDNSGFEPSFQQRQGPNMNPPNGWWNPAGDGVWRLLGCGITTAFLNDGAPASGQDPVLAMSVADSDDSVAAKIVDLDPQQQMVSTIFGLTVRIADGNGNTRMSGSFDPAPFSDIWGRIQQGGAAGDMAYGAMWQSVISDVQWGDVSDSPFLLALQTAASANGGLLSMKFNVDSYNMDYPVPGQSGGDSFCRGRIVGTIGVAAVDEPRHFVLGRQLVTQQQYPAAQNPPQYQPPLYAYCSYLNHCPVVVDSSNNVIRIDLGNALPVGNGGLMLDQGQLSLVVPDAENNLTILGTLSADGIGGYATAGWYPSTAGIVEFTLPPGAASLIGASPLGLTLSSPITSPFSGFTTPTGVLTGEIPPCPGTDGNSCPGGLFVRADEFVLRLSPGESQTISFYATQYGQPFSGQTLNIALNPSGLQGPMTSLGNPPPPTQPSQPPCVGYPFDGLLAQNIAFTTPVIQATTDSNGCAQVVFTGGGTQQFRSYIDGQVYGVGYALAAQGFNPADTFSVSPTPFNGDAPPAPLPLYQACLDTSNFVSVLVFDSFSPDNPVTWHGCLQPIFQQYANLYPVMSRFINLGDVNQVIPYARMLLRAFSLPDSDPNAMPVTRDLSPAKRKAILQWLQDPQLGTPPLAAPSHAATMAVHAAPPSITKGGKSAAMGTMLRARFARL